MKKYLVTETQIKKIVDSILQEQTDIQLTTAAVQCFLNKVMKTNLKVDGINGPDTKKALQIFQQKKVKMGNRIDTDGVWGYNTSQTLTPQERKIWDECTKKYNF